MIWFIGNRMLSDAAREAVIYYQDRGLEAVRFLVSQREWAARGIRGSLAGLPVAPSTAIPFGVLFVYVKE